MEKTTFNDKYFGQQCQDDKINIAFRNLHKQLVDEIIGFCKAYNIVIDEFHLYADCFRDSIKIGSWQPCTDSSLVFEKFTDEWKNIINMDKSIDNKEYKKVKLDQKPFLVSM